MCYDFQYEKLRGYTLTGMVATFTSVFNIGIRYVVIAMINNAKLETKSQVTTAVMVFVFFASLINSAFIGLLANADFYYNPFLGRIFSFLHNQYADINRDWYNAIGPQMVQTLLIMAVFPWLEIVLYTFMQKVKQWKDSGLPCCPNKWSKDDYDQETDDRPRNAMDEDDDDFAPPDRFIGVDEDGNEYEEISYASLVTPTQLTNKRDYIALYAGLEYLIHFKYSSVLVQIYLAFMYGMFIPILFPIAAFGIANMYITEKISLIYIYREPPMYDETLNKKALEILKKAPIMMFVMGYWAMGNTAIFEGRAEIRTFFNRSADPQHCIIDLSVVNQSHFAFLIFLYWFGREFIYDAIYVNCLLKCKNYICGIVEFKHESLADQ